jgi:hypothetical protein
MNCGYCGKEIDPKDPNYGKTAMHKNCMIQLQNDMEKCLLIKVSPSCRMSYSLTKKFEKFLNRSMNHTRLHITHDDTVDEDIIDMQGVIRAVSDYVKNSVPQRKLWLFSEIIFNGFMAQKYGLPIPVEKQFSSRAKEFVTEVYNVETNEEEFKLFNRILKKNAHERTTKMPKTPHRMVKVADINKEFEDELEKASLDILSIIDKTAIRIEELGASRQWRNFRKDELLLQTVQDLIMKHLKLAPIPEVILEESDVQIYNNSISTLFADITELSSIIAKKHNVPVGVVFARILANVMMNLVLGYMKIQSDYSKKHS